MFCTKCGTENKNDNITCKQCGKSLDKSNNNFITILFITIFLLVSISIIPIGTNYLVDNKIKQYIKQLKDIGIDLEVESSNGYIVNKKDVTFKINNGRYFANNILNEFSKSVEIDLKIYLNALKNSNIDWEALLNGTTIKGKLTTHNYFVDKPKLDIFLKKLSHEIMFKIKKDKKLSKIILPLIEKKILSGSIDFNKRGNFSKIKLNDIDETIVEKNDRIVFQLLDNIFTKNTVNIGRVYLSVKNDEEVSVLQFDKIRSLMDSDKSVEVNIDNISFIIDKLKFNARNFISTHIFNNKTQKVSLLENISLEDIKIDTEDLPISIDRINYNLTLEDMGKSQVNQLIEDYKNKLGEIDNYGEYEIKNIFRLLNEGLSLKVNTSLKNLKTKDINSGKYSFQTNLKIIKNDLTLKNISLNRIIKTIKSTNGDKNSFINFEIDKESANIIMNNSREFENIFENLGYLENNKYSFNFRKKDGKVLLNNLKLPIVSEILADNFFNNKKYRNAIPLYKFSVENGNVNANFKLAYSYTEIKEYDLAIKHYLNFINETNKTNTSSAMNNLANIYKFTQNYKNAIKWYLKSISNGFKSPNYFGIAYSYNKLKDYKNAEKWYLKSINKENEKFAMWNLGLIYQYGRGKITKDFNKAFNLYLKAAKIGYKPAMKKVSLFYKYGYGTNIDYIKANYWNRKYYKTK